MHKESDEQRFGRRVDGWRVPPRPGKDALVGRYVTVEPLDMAHLHELHEANSDDDTIWDYLPYGPFASADDYADWLTWASESDDPRFFALRSKSSGWAEGVASYLRINPEAGSIEVGHINLSVRIQRTIAATEAMYLMMRWAFEAGYRRYEWKCNALNMGSRRAAERLGLSYEGVFRQAGVVKGRNRDTAWFAAIDAEWPALESAFRQWLSPDNFSEDGAQKRRLSDLTAPIRVSSDPLLNGNLDPP